MSKGGARPGAGRKATGRNPRKKVSIMISCTPEEKNKTISQFLIDSSLLDNAK